MFGIDDRNFLSCLHFSIERQVFYNFNLLLYCYCIQIEGPPANRVNFKCLKKIKNIGYHDNSYIYKEVHTLAFAEITESVVLKHNTEQKKNTTLHSTRNITSSRCPSITLLNTQQADCEHCSWPYTGRDFKNPGRRVT